MSEPTTLEVYDEVCLECGQTIGMGMDPVVKLSRDIREVSSRQGRWSARHLVNMYYMYQEYRMTLAAQIRALSAAEEPTELLEHFFAQLATLEKQAALALGDWSLTTEVGRWSRDQLGIGPVLAAGLMAHIDITKARTAGAIWRYAGLDPSFEWLGRRKAEELVEEFVPARTTPTRDQIEAIAARLHRRASGIEALASLGAPGDGEDSSDRTITRAKLISALARRPYNARLKMTCWKIGDSFVKVSGRPNAVYGRLYREQKAKLVEKNASRGFAELAATTLAERNIQHAPLRRTYEDGRLPDGRIDAMARRWTVKLFLSHWHDVAYREEHGEPPPNPYPIEHLGHTDYIPVPRG